MKKEGLVAPKGEVKQTVWAEANEGVDPKIVDKRKNDNQFTWCRIKNRIWKFCRKAVQVSAVSRG